MHDWLKALTFVSPFREVYMCMRALVKESLINETYLQLTVYICFWIKIIFKQHNTKFYISSRVCNIQGGKVDFRCHSK